MALDRRAGYCAHIASLLVLVAGCRVARPERPIAQAVEPLDPVAHTRLPAPAAGPGAGQAKVVQVAHQVPVVPAATGQPMAMPQPAATSHSAAMRQEFDGLLAPELSLADLTREVEARNPSLQAMIYAWRAMAERYPQAVALDDPMFMTMMAPASFGSNQVESAYVLSGTQKIPWAGKRAIRGDAARAETSAAQFDVQDTRLQIAQVTRAAFFEYYLVERSKELIDENARAMQQLRDTARVKYENNQVTELDVLQADVELTDIERRQIENDRMRRVAAARINTLLRRDPMAALPPPPQTLRVGGELPPVADLRGMALAQRPDLSALGARVRAEEAAVNLALRQYYPDTEVFGRYDSFWQPASTQSDLRGQVGFNMNVPIYRQKLQAAVCEAQFRLSQRRAEYRQRELDIDYEVHAAYEQVRESRRTAQLYAEKFLPFAEQNVAVARANYDVGKTTFLNLVQAQRQLLEVREKYQQTLADFHRRRSELERVVGGLPPTAEVLPRPDWH